MGKLYLSIILSFFLIITSCNRGNVNNQKRHLVNIAGSTSVMPFTEKLAEYFMVGHPEYIVNVQSGGSTAGIQACINGTVHIGMSSRELKEDEKVLNEIVICYDGIAIIVNPKNPINDLTLEQVRNIFSGKVKNWKDLGWINRRIDAVTREEGSGTRGAFEELVMHKVHIDDGIMVQDSNGSVKEVVATDPYAIGYVSLGMVDKKVKALKIDGVEPSIENIKQKKYKVVRPFLYLTKGKPEADAQVFIDFVLSKEGQGILKKEGLVPVND
ncbi:MAG: phosphate ABC transporter substrate-binding protein [Proteobacteria bacterium]|nr:phosphate ABC transporter substrate-binding protein [Pseudomonadota bacterium]